MWSAPCHYWMGKVSLLVALVSVVSALRCGRQVIKGERRALAKVVGGQESYRGEFPWVISIRKHSNHHCGGVIVGQRWILTAAHCVQNRALDSLAVRVGEQDLVQSGQYTRDYPVEQIYVHHNYSRISASNHSVRLDNADIALLKTGEEIHFNEYVWPVCLPPSQPVELSNEVLVVGWGKTSEKSEAHSERLQVAKLRIVANDQCQRWFRQAGRDLALTDRLLCAGYEEGGRDACHGDSGGPLLTHYRSSITGAEVYYVTGIVSTGIGCARPLLPGIYSNVFSYLDWINRTILQFN